MIDTGDSKIMAAAVAAWMEWNTALEAYEQALMGGPRVMANLSDLKRILVAGDKVTMAERELDRAIAALAAQERAIEQDRLGAIMRERERRGGQARERSGLEQERARG